MKKDIESRADIELLLTDFYRVATDDEKIGYFFTEVVQLDLETHLPVITNFWEKILFGAPVYSGNPFHIHQRINAKSPIGKEHFARWIEIFRQAVDRHFAGATAERAKERAAQIANVMLMRLQESRTAPLYQASR